MDFSKEQLLARLKELHINFSQNEHPAILTVQEGEKYVGHLGGGLSKSLFLKYAYALIISVLHDKKQRFYLVFKEYQSRYKSRAALSQRLGLGKGGLRMAPSEALGEILQVPLGCVTPFAVMNESARDVSLLLDQGFKTQEHCFFHPLSNDMTISKVVNPSVSGKNTKEKAGNKAHSSSNYSAVELFVEEILHKTLRLLPSEIKEDSIKQYGENLGSLMSENLRKGLRSDLRNLAMIFKNTSFTEGFHAGNKHQSGRL